MDHAKKDYYRLRESQERAAAKVASNLAARRAHQELAEHYARAVHGEAFRTLSQFRAAGAL